MASELEKMLQSPLWIDQLFRKSNVFFFSALYINWEIGSPVVEPGGLTGVLLTGISNRGLILLRISLSELMLPGSSRSRISLTDLIITGISRSSNPLIGLILFSTRQPVSPEGNPEDSLDDITSKTIITGVRLSLIVLPCVARIFWDQSHIITIHADILV
jgi:hypothetical protein